MIQKIRYALADRNLSVISSITDISYMSLVRIANGTTLNPSPETIQRLNSYLKIESLDQLQSIKEISSISSITKVVLSLASQVSKQELTAEEAADYLRSSVTFNG